MTRESAPALSAHLLREAEGFLFFPDRVRRTERNLAAQEILDQVRRNLIEWRKTFTPRGKEELAASAQKLFDPVFLDEIYARDLSKTVPNLVERTLRLSRVSFSGIPRGESLMYLREAANCYIFGLPQAAIALARASVESRLRGKAASLLGRSAVAEMDFKALLDDMRVSRLLSKDANKRADAVRIAANRVLHEELATEADALSVVESARIVLSELG